MGHTLTQWTDHVEELVRDTGNKDLNAATVQAVGIVPALAQFAVDRPRLVVQEYAGAGSSRLAIPSSWVDGLSSIAEVEYPARQSPPVMLDPTNWDVVRSVSDVTVLEILLGVTPPTGSYVRVTYSSSWPTPTATAGDDKVDDVAYEAVCCLAASLLEVALASAAARARMGALPTDFVDGRERARLLLDAAKAHRATYDAFLGRGSGVGSGAGGGKTAPAWGSYDADPQRDSLYHLQRR